MPCFLIAAGSTTSRLPLSVHQPSASASTSTKSSAVRGGVFLGEKSLPFFPHLQKKSNTSCNALLNVILIPFFEPASLTNARIYQALQTSQCFAQGTKLFQSNHTETMALNEQSSSFLYHPNQNPRHGLDRHGLMECERLRSARCHGTFHVTFGVMMMDFFTFICVSYMESSTLTRPS